MLRKGIVSIFFLSFLANLLHGGGWNNTLLGCRAIAMGGAFSAVADDASAIFYNPSGLAFMKSNFNFSLNGFYIWPTHEYTLPSGRKIESRYSNPLPQLFFTFKTSSKITLGVGFYVPYAGGGVDWKEEFLGYPLKSTLGIFSITPAFAYQFSEKFSLGLNLNFYRALLNVKTKMEPFGPMSEEESGTAISGGLSMMYRPTERLSFGLSFRGPAKMRLAGETSLSYGPYKIKLDSETFFRLPWDMEAGFSFWLSERLLFSASGQYTMWSVLDKVEKTIRGVPLTGDIKVDEIMDFHNILILRAGLEYAFPQGVFLRAGIGLDPYATPASALNITNIDVKKFTILGGVGYRAGKMQIDFAYVYAMGSEREKVIKDFGSNLREKYNLNVFILGMGLTFSF